MVTRHDTHPLECPRSALTGSVRCRWYRMLQPLVGGDRSLISRLSFLWLALVLAVLTACSGTELMLPDRTNVAVQAEEQRIATLLRSTTNVWIPGECNVRLLGQEDPTSYVWADCSDGLSGTSLPLRIDGEQVSAPGEGSLFLDDVTRMFPAELADAIFARDERIFP